MKINIVRILSYFVDFISINGFYAIIMVFSLLNLDIESRIYTIPTRISVVCVMVLLILLKRYKPGVNSVVYVFFTWFFVFYWIKIIMEAINGTQDIHIPPYEFLLYSIVYCFFPFIYYSQRKTEAAFEQIFRAILLSGIIFSIITVFLFFITSDKSGMFDRYLIGISPITVSYVGSLVVGICFSQLVFNRDYKKTRLMILGILIGMGPFLIGGSRGPIVALAVPLFIALVYKTGKLFSRKTIMYALIVFIILSLALGIFGNLAFARITNIFKDLSAKDADASRLVIWETAFKQFLHSPIWGDSIQIKGGFGWPHNLSLEVLMSTGLIGYIPFLILMCFGVYRSFIILIHYPAYIWLYVFFLQTLIMGMLSGTVYSDIWYWSSLGMVIAVDFRRENVSSGFSSQALLNS